MEVIKRIDYKNIELLMLGSYLAGLDDGYLDYRFSGKHAKNIIKRVKDLLIKETS